MLNTYFENNLCRVRLQLEVNFEILLSHIEFLNKILLYTSRIHLLFRIFYLEYIIISIRIFFVVLVSQLGFLARYLGFRRKATQNSSVMFPKGLSPRMGMQTRCIWPWSGTRAIVVGQLGQELWQELLQPEVLRRAGILAATLHYSSGHLAGFWRVFVGC